MKQNIFIKQLKEVGQDIKKNWAIYVVLGPSLFFMFLGILYLAAIIDSL